MKKKKSPVKVVVPLILAVAAAGVGYKVVNRYIPSKEVMDGNEYFGTSGGEDAAVVLPDRLEQGKALVKDGTAYVEYATAKENLNDHLYKSDEEQQVILTTAVDIIKLRMTAMNIQRLPEMAACRIRSLFRRMEMSILHWIIWHSIQHFSIRWSRNRFILL